MNNWKSEILKKFKHLKMQIEETSSPGASLKMLFTGEPPHPVIYLPHKPDEKTIMEIQALVPEDVEVDFVEAIKPATINQIRFILSQGGALQGFAPISETSVRDMIVSVTMPGGVEAEETSPLWDELSQELYNDGFLDTWTIKIGNKSRLYNRAVMNEVRSRRIGTETITNETILDLQILLNTTKQDSADFLRAIGMEV